MCRLIKNTRVFRGVKRKETLYRRVFEHKNRVHLAMQL